MKIKILLGFLGFMVLATGTGAANRPEEWKYFQQVEVSKPGLVKLSLPVDSLAAARPGLEDLRIIDSTGHEVPYLLERPFQPERLILGAQKFSFTLADHATTIILETGLSQPIQGITLETAAPNFIKAVRIEGSTDRKDWQTITQDQPLFRQPYGAGSLHLTIPPAVWPWLRLTLDDRRSKPVAFTGAKLHAAVKPLPLESLPVTIVNRRENDQKTRITLNLGGANLTLATVQVEADDPLFMRQVTAAVSALAENEISERSLATGTIYRVALDGQQVSSELAIPINQQITNRELLLLIDNQDNPPLNITAVKAQRRPVYLTFFASQAGVYRLLSGNPRCLAARYDLISLAASLQETTVSPLTLTSLADNPSYRPPESLPEIQDLGTDLDTTAWKSRKLVQIKQAGVQQFDLDVETLAGAGPSLSDLRLWRDGKQRPYILERTTVNVKLTPLVSLIPDPKKPSRSRWQIKLPHSGLPLKRLSCTTSTPIFQRQVHLLEQPANERGEPYDRQLGQATWLRTPTVTAPTLELDLTRSPRTDTLILETDNGDNPPIELDNCQLYYFLTRVLCKAPLDPATYLYYGNNSVGPPQYDLALVAPQLLAAEKSVATLGAAEPLQKPGWGDIFQTSTTRSVVFWGALAVVVVVLLVVMARLLPQTPSKE
jgi:hypothetical protein